MKSQIRKEIENILGREFNNGCFIDGWRTKKTYRMKLVSRNQATSKQIEQIKKLPHVIEVGYVPNFKHFGYSGGITVRFDCKPSKIKF